MNFVDFVLFHDNWQQDEKYWGFNHPTSAAGRTHLTGQILCSLEKRTFRLNAISAHLACTNHSRVLDWFASLCACLFVCLCAHACVRACFSTFANSCAVYKFMQKCTI